MIFQFHCNGNIKRLFGLPGLLRLSGPGEIAENWASHGINLFGLFGQ